MANEIKVSASLSVTNGNMSERISTGTISLNQSAVGGPVPGYQVIGTTQETAVLSELSSLGWIFIQNLDTTNYVRWGFSSGTYGGQLKPKEFAMFRLWPGTTLYMIANLSACKCIIKAFED